MKRTDETKSTFDKKTLPAHDSIVVRANAIKATSNVAAGMMTAIFAEALETSFPKNHDNIERALRALRLRLVKAKIVGPDGGKSRMTKIGRKLRAEKVEAERKAAEKAKQQPDGGTEVAGMTHASNGVTAPGTQLETALRENVLALSQVLVRDENVEMEGPDPLDAGVMLTGTASMFVDPSRVPVLKEPQAMADAITAAAEHLDRLGAGYDPDIIAPAIENLCKQAAEQKGGITTTVDSGEIDPGFGRASVPPAEVEGKREAAGRFDVV